MTIPCIVYTRIPAGTDEYGNVMYAETATPSRCFLQPASQLEIQDGRAEYGDYMLHLPADIAGFVDGFARVEVNGISYEASGPAAVYTSLLSPEQTHHVEIAVARGTA
jgi:hypothetical protein